MTGLSGGVSIGSASTGWYSDGTNLAARPPSGAFFVQTPNGGATYARIGAAVNGLSVDTGNLAVVSGNETVSGSVQAQSFLYNSDRSLKTNITDLDPQTALNDILQLQGVSFDWKATGRPDIGVIAQDVQKVFPQLVSTDPKTGLESVEYGNLVAPLIEAVKAQQAEIDSLKAQVQTLEAGK